jgi:hypothetical protein
MLCVLAGEVPIEICEKSFSFVAVVVGDKETHLLPLVASSRELGKDLVDASGF